jgi:endoglucanase
MRKFIFFTLSLFAFHAFGAEPGPLRINEKDYFETRGVNVLVFSNWYNGLFDDSKMSGIELIHHGVRTVTNGDVRLNATPEQWDAIPEFVERKVDRKNGVIQAWLKYSKYDFEFSIRAEATTDGLAVSVHLPKPLPAELQGKAGFNLEFLPAAYFEKSFMMDRKYGTFPLYPTGPKEQNDKVSPAPLARGHRLVLAPDDPERTVTIQSPGAELSLYDGRNKAQNGWFVVRSLLPTGKTGKVLEWTLKARSVEGWERDPVIAHSQLGYHPDQQKVAVIELDPNSKPDQLAGLYRVNPDGSQQQKHSAVPKAWGRYKRYDYRSFDFSDITEEGIYLIKYAGQKTAPFRIARDVYQGIWHPTLDVYFPVQMDHMLVNEAYRVWHGASHLDDALQAPVDHRHFDLYAQGPTTDTPFEPGQHIPGLNIGGWYDAGDYDIRTQTQYAVVRDLVNVWETFQPGRDNTLVDYERKYVDIHVPDGKSDLLQQIEHGTLALVAQHRAVGHAIPGIIVPDLSQYTHLGDGLTMTDNLIYSAEMEELESDGLRSGKFDDRWAFTSYSSGLNYGSIAALAAASRALKGHNNELAKESLQIAVSAWDEEQSHQPVIFQHGNTTGGPLPVEALRAALELLVSTGDQKYAEQFLQHLPDLEASFELLAIPAVRAMPYLDEDYTAWVRQQALVYRKRMDELAGQNPFGVQITEGGWAGNGTIIHNAMANYYLLKVFPDIFGPEDVFRGMNYILGTHPGSDISFVSAVGTQSKKVAYGMNRADYSYIAGGIVPGVLILKPDFPENKEDWPFLWGENEYVITLGATYLFLANAVNELSILMEGQRSPAE